VNGELFAARIRVRSVSSAQRSATPAPHHSISYERHIHCDTVNSFTRDAGVGTEDINRLTGAIIGNGIKTSALAGYGMGYLRRATECGANARALRGGTDLKNLSTHPNQQPMDRYEFLTAPLSPLTLD
jgi:hypothetical protein